MTTKRLFAACLFGLVVADAPLTAAAQSTSATVFGSVADEQKAALVGVTITVTNRDTGEVRTVSSDSRGGYRVIGLAPGRYELRAVFPPFAEVVQPDVVLGLSQETAVTLTMRLAAVADRITVTDEAPVGGMPLTTLGRGFTTAEIEELPVAARDFATLAILSPGIGAMAGTMRTNATGITAAGQTGRNNTFLIDGLSIDDNRQNNVRGTLSLDAIKEFMVLSNSYSAEYGQASGAVISVLTRSGANRHAGRAFYYHRDDAWDATSAAASLTSPPETKSSLQQQSVGGFIGGPIRRDRTFFFGSVEQNDRQTEQFVTSPSLHVFRPGADVHLPVKNRSTLAFGRADVNLDGASQLTLRYRIDRALDTNQVTDGNPAGLTAPERRADITRHNQDFAVLYNRVFGARSFYELKLQGGRRANESDVSGYCPDCIAENRQGIFLGKSAVAPIATSEDRWQALNAFTWLVPGTAGDHTLKFGVDASLLQEAGVEPAGFAGIFDFETNEPFDPSNDATYPTRYLRNEGNPATAFRGSFYAAFLQDSWAATRTLTVNAGVRWDYVDAPGIAHDTDNLAPRLGLAFTPRPDGHTTLRASYGVFYDQVLLIISNNALRAEGVTQTQFRNPGYPDPFGFNPNRSSAINVAIPSTTLLSPDMDTPVTNQAALGVHQRVGRFALTVDGVWARGRHLLRSFDLNYPDLDAPGRPRPNPAFQRILVRESKGNSWYRGLLIGLRKRHAARHSYGVTYTWSSTERDTEDFDFLAQDQRDYAAERGPAANDARHRFSASANLDLPIGLRFTSLMTARSALPYNVTTGSDDNSDVARTDRPPGVSRNSSRGAAAWQLDLRIAKSITIGPRRLELLVEAFNVTNQSNWTAFDGVLANETFGRPTSAGDPRQIQVGLRLDF